MSASAEHQAPQVGERWRRHKDLEVFVVSAGQQVALGHAQSWHRLRLTNIDSGRNHWVSGRGLHSKYERIEGE